MRHYVVAWILCTALVACNTTPESHLIKPDVDESGFTGGVVADEPRAAMIAHEILNKGGTAADAAVALSFALSATYPVAASLGGGGVCLVYDGPTKSAEAVDFLPRPPLVGGSIAVPGTVRGVAALHSRYGRLDWDELVRPAELIAREGHQVSRALSSRLGRLKSQIMKNLELKKIFSTQDGDGILSEGDYLKQIALSSVLAQIRIRGPGEFYVGQAGINFVNGARRSGGSITLADMRATLPIWRGAANIGIGQFSIYAAPAPVVGGIVAGQIVAMLADGNRLEESSTSERMHLFAEATSRAYNDRRNAAERRLSEFRAHALMRNYQPKLHTALLGDNVSPIMVEGAENGTTSFVTIDREGSSVACMLTMGRELGIQGLDPVTGIVWAPPLTGDDLAFLASVIVVDKGQSNLIFAASASGNAAGPAAIGQALMGLLIEDVQMIDQLNAARVFLGGNPDITLVEPNVGDEIIQALSKRGHNIKKVPALGRLNSVYCSQKLPDKGRECDFINDRRGFGLALGKDHEE